MSGDTNTVWRPPRQQCTLSSVAYSPTRIAPWGAGVAARVHVAITGEGELGRLKTPFAVSLTPGRITLGGAEGTLAQAWQGRSGVCVVSGPQGMLDDVKRLAVDHLSIPVDLCHLLEA